MLISSHSKAPCVLAAFLMLGLLCAHGPVFAKEKGKKVTPVEAAPAASEVKKQAEQAIGTRQTTQKQVDKFAAKEADLLDKAEQLEQELKSVIKQRQKTEAYLAGQKAKVAELQRRLDEMELIRAKLEPYLDQTLTRLIGFIAQDLPFLKTERSERIASLEDTLNDYDASLADKTRRILEALAIEARYGNTVDANEAEIDIQGKVRRVRVFRLGRLGLFALSFDGHKAWRFNPQNKAYEPVEGYNRGLTQACDIADRRRVVSLVEVPIGNLHHKEAAK